MVGKKCFISLSLISIAILFNYQILFAQNKSVNLNKKVTLIVEQITITDALDTLSLITKTPFTYSSDIFSKDKKINIKLRNTNLKRALNHLLKNTDIRYNINSGKIVFYKPLPQNNQTAQKSNSGKKKTPSKNQKQYYTFSGYISDVETGEKLIGAHIYEISGQQGSISNNYGFFSLTLPSGDYDFMFSYIGYASRELNLLLDENHSKNVMMKSMELEVVEVKDNRHSPKGLLSGSAASRLPINLQNIKDMPALGGETDVLRSMQNLPGIQSGKDGSSGLFVRGGSIDQNLILLDGVPVYNSGHVLGFLSIFNPDAINKIDLYKGGFPSRFGGRLSSVLDIRTREGDMNTLKLKGSLSTLASRLTIEGPVLKNKVSFFISGRRSFVDLFWLPKNRQLEGGFQYLRTKPYLFDINGKINYKISHKDRIYFSFYNGSDHYEEDNSWNSDIYMSERHTLLNWGNNIFTFRWNHLWTNKLFSNLTLNHSRYFFDIYLNNSQHIYNENKDVLLSSNTQSLYYNSNAQEWTLNLNFDYAPHPDHFARFGIQAGVYSFLPGGRTSVRNTHNDTLLQKNETHIPYLDGVEVIAFAEDDFNISKQLKTNIGIRTSFYSAGFKNYFSFQPRLSCNYRLSNSFSLKAAWEKMNQRLHLLSNSGIGLPTDLWISSTDHIKPQQSWQTSLGLYHLPDKKWTISVEAFYKEMKNIIVYKSGTSLLLNSELFSQKVITGKGNAYGLEFFIHKNTGRTTGQLAYSLAWSNRQFEELNGGKPFPFDYDRRHSFSISFHHRFNKNLKLNANWLVMSGRPYTFAVRQYDINSPIYNPIDENTTNPEKPHTFALETEGAINNIRLKPYHRLDLSISWQKKTKWGNHNVSFSLYNTYNRINTFYIDKYTQVDDKLGYYSFYDNSLFPIVPGLAYQFEINNINLKRKTKNKKQTMKQRKK